jgi:hypothetical protein
VTDNHGLQRSIEDSTTASLPGVMHLVRAEKRGAPGRIRTSDTWFRKPLLYPLSYEGGMQRG